MQANKGEWSELYALFAIFANHKVPAADKNLDPIGDEYEFLKVSVDTIRSWIKKDPNFPAYKVGRLWRFRKTDLDSWVKSGAINGRD